MSVDPDEIAKFDQLAERWWNPDGEMKGLHALNPLRLEYIEKQTSLAGKRVLDLGCGGGILSEALAKKYAEVTAIDLSENAIAIAKQHAEQQQLDIDYRMISAEALCDSMAGQFDIISCMEMLEHVPDPSAILQSCSKLIKPDGLLFLSTINRTVKSFLGAVVAAEYLLRLLPTGTHEYKKFIRPSELEQWARQHQFQLTDLQGIHYHVLTGRFSYCNNTDINYLASFQYEQ